MQPITEFVNSPASFNLGTRRTVSIEYLPENDMAFARDVQSLRDAGCEVRIRLVPLSKGGIATGMPVEAFPYGLRFDRAYDRSRSDFTPTMALAEIMGRFYAKDGGVTIVL